MFGLPAAVAGSGLEPTGPVGDQIRGFGYLHDGAISTVFDFVSANIFQRLDRDPMNPAGPHIGTTDRRNLEAFLHGFDTGLRPAVGQQVSATPSTFNDANVVGRINLLIARDDAGDCDLVVKGVLGGIARGAVYVGGNQFQLDRNTDSLLTATALRNMAGTAGQELTYTCVPPGSGIRIGVDRDEDNLFDRSELDQGSDPADPLDPGGVTTTTTISGGGTTTTLPLGGCAEALACLEVALAQPLCGGEPINPKLQAIIAVKLGKARSLLQKAAAAADTKVARLVARARKQLGKVGTKADAFVTKKKRPITAGCRDGIHAALDRIDGAITAARARRGRRQKK